MTLFLFSSFKQELYLGVVFWREFGTAPQVFDLEKITAQKNGKQKKIEPEPHVLEAPVQEIRKSFLSDEEHGLGRTSVMKHTIELVKGAVPVKDRHYPVSPAEQKFIYEEKDEMLRLGVIIPLPW